MDGYQRAACWIDRFANRLQEEHGMLREEAMEIAAREWAADGDSRDREAAAQALFDRPDESAAASVRRARAPAS